MKKLFILFALSSLSIVASAADVVVTGTIPAGYSLRKVIGQMTSTRENIFFCSEFTECGLSGTRYRNVNATIETINPAKQQFTARIYSSDIESMNNAFCRYQNLYAYVEFVSPEGVVMMQNLKQKGDQWVVTQ